MPKKIDLTGRKFGRLTVLEQADYAYDYKNHRMVMWKCQCDCPDKKIVYVHSSNLLNGNSKSCGCYAKDRTRETRITHGKRSTRLYSIYANMKNRCSNPNCNRYSLYGGKGIKVCDEWLNNFQSFYDWAMANGYSDELTLDRKDNSKDYCPENCRWSTMKEQQNNRTNNHFVEINGVVKTIHEWCDSKEYEASYSTVYGRISLGWDVVDAITRPIDKRCRRKK